MYRFMTSIQKQRIWQDKKNVTQTISLNTKIVRYLLGYICSDVALSVGVDRRGREMDSGRV